MIGKWVKLVGGLFLWVPVVFAFVNLFGGSSEFDDRARDPDRSPAEIERGSQEQLDNETLFVLKHVAILTPIEFADEKGGFDKLGTYVSTTVMQIYFIRFVVGLLIFFDGLSLLDKIDRKT